MLKATLHLGALTNAQEALVSDALDQLDVTWMFEQDEETDTYVLHVAGVDTNPAVAVTCRLLTQPNALD